MLERPGSSKNFAFRDFVLFAVANKEYETMAIDKRNTIMGGLSGWLRPEADGIQALWFMASGFRAVQRFLTYFFHYLASICHDFYCQARQPPWCSSSTLFGVPRISWQTPFSSDTCSRMCSGTFFQSFQNRFEESWSVVSPVARLGSGDNMIFGYKTIVYEKLVKFLNL